MILNVTVAVADIVRKMQVEVLPIEVVGIAKYCILDYLGVTYAGAHDLQPQIASYLDAVPTEKESCSVIGSKRRTSMFHAALLNGMSAHYFEMDDGSRFGMVHLGAPILSALFAVGQCYPITAADFLRAVVVGYEITIRLAAALQPDHKKKGFHATGTCGCIGAAVGVATALRFSQDDLENVIAAAAASSSGLLEMIEGTSQLKPFNAGKAAQNAIVAAFVGKAGFAGPSDPLGGKRGLVGAMGETLNEKWLKRSDENRYAIMGIYRKPYASCRHCHPAVEAALKLQQNDAIDWTQIDFIEVQTYNLAVLGHDHTVVESTGSAKMSIPFSIAAALVLNDAGIKAMSEHALKDKRILSLAKKVRVIENPDYSVLVPQQRNANVKITLKDGRQLSLEVKYPKGEPENPMSSEELEKKFLQMMQYAGKETPFCNEIIRDIRNFEIGYIKLIKRI